MQLSTLADHGKDDVRVCDAVLALVEGYIVWQNKEFSYFKPTL